MQEVKLTITKSWNNLKDFYNSDEMLDLWSGIRGRNSELQSSQEWHDDGDIVFEKGVMINGDLYQLYKTEGVNRILKMTTYTCVSNQNLSMCSVRGDKITFMDKDIWFSKSDTKIMRSMPNHIFFGNL
tara:strand:+ start:1930 stop:2313 length:384 start_codon:yes stop_codon:yes gene_type:complete